MKKLLKAISEFREAFVIFAGDNSPSTKKALRRIDAAVKKATKEHFRAPERIYYAREENGHFYVYYMQTGVVETLFDVVSTREQADIAIKNHKEGKHETQEYQER